MFSQAYVKNSVHKGGGGDIHGGEGLCGRGACMAGGMCGKGACMVGGAWQGGHGEGHAWQGRCA